MGDIPRLDGVAVQVGVTQSPAIVDIIELSVRKFPEISFTPEFFDKLVGVIFCKAVDLAAFFHGIDQSHTIGGSEKGGDFADDMFSGAQGFYGILSVVGEKGRHKDNIKILFQKFIFIPGDKGVGAEFAEIGTESFVEITPGDDLKVQLFALRDECPSPSKSPNAQTNLFLSFKYLAHFCLIVDGCCTKLENYLFFKIKLFLYICKFIFMLYFIEKRCKFI